MTDYVGVLEIDDFDIVRHDLFDFPRILFVIKGISEGYELSFQDLNLVRNKGEGGVFGDPILPLTTDGSSFEINAYGGSAWRWLERSKFTYFDDEWFLTELETSYGYGLFNTHYRNFDYLKGVGVVGHNSDLFEDMEKRGENFTPYELSYDIELDEPPTLEQTSMNWLWADSRLEEIMVEEIQFLEEINPDHYDMESLREFLKSPLNIKKATEEYIIYHYVSDNTYEIVVLYDRKTNIATVMLEDRYESESYYNVYDEILVHDGRLYYSRNHQEKYYITKTDGTTDVSIDVKKTGLHSMSLDGLQKRELAVFNNEPDGDRYPYFTIGFECHRDKIYVYVYRDGIRKFYKMNNDGDDLEFLGEV